MFWIFRMIFWGPWNCYRSFKSLQRNLTFISDETQVIWLIVSYVSSLFPLTSFETSRFSAFCQVVCPKECRWHIFANLLLLRFWRLRGEVTQSFRKLFCISFLRSPFLVVTMTFEKIKNNKFSFYYILYVMLTNVFLAWIEHQHIRSWAWLIRKVLKWPKLVSKVLINNFKLKIHLVFVIYRTFLI